MWARHVGRLTGPDDLYMTAETQRNNKTMSAGMLKAALLSKFSVKMIKYGQNYDQLRLLQSPLMFRLRSKKNTRDSITQY